MSASEPVPAPSPTMTQRASVEAVVVILMVLMCLAVVGAGLYIAVTGGKMDTWEIVALWFSGILTGVLASYGLFKANQQQTNNP